MDERPEVVHTGDPMGEAGERLARAVRGVLEGSAHARLAVPGGSALGALGPARIALGREFERVKFTWVDERCVPVDDPESNRGAAERAGWLGPDLAPRNIVPLFIDDERPADAVARTRDELKAIFSSALDVVLLGLGEDGHVASLFPGHFDAASESTVAHVADSPKPPSDRVTLTRPMLATARATILVAMGEAKRAALARLIAGDDALPACGLPGLTIVSDLDMSAVKRDGGG